MGDSKVVIDWLNYKGKLHSTAIEGWNQRTLELATSFQGIYFQHIYRDFNMEVDHLKKHTLLDSRGRFSYYFPNISGMEALLARPIISICSNVFLVFEVYVVIRRLL